MEGLSASQGIKKQPLIPHMGQELYSCDTTQIGVKKHPLASRAITRARWITGGYPSADTEFPVQAALRSPFTRPLPVPLPLSGTRCRFAPVGYYSSSKVSVIYLLLSLYTSVHRLSTLFFIAQIKCQSKKRSDCKRQVRSIFVSLRIWSILQFSALQALIYAQRPLQIKAVNFFAPKRG